MNKIHLWLKQVTEKVSHLLKIYMENFLVGSFLIQLTNMFLKKGEVWIRNVF